MHKPTFKEIGEIVGIGMAVVVVLMSANFGFWVVALTMIITMSAEYWRTAHRAKRAAS